MSKTLIRLGILDDHVLVRDALVSYLSQNEKYHIQFQSSDIESLPEKLESTPVDILLMDTLPRVTARDTLALIRNKFTDTKVIIVSACTEIDIINEMIDLNVDISELTEKI